MELRMSNVRIDGDRLPLADVEILPRLVCDLSVSAGDVDIYSERDFPFAEFASQAATSLTYGAAGAPTRRGRHVDEVALPLGFSVIARRRGIPSCRPSCWAIGPSISPRPRR